MLLFLTTNEAQKLPFWNDIQAFKKQDSIAIPALYKTLFIGSSSFTKWKTLEQDLPEYAPLNRAFGGSTLLDVIRYRKDVFQKYNPERIVIYCGENDVASSDTVTTKIVFDRFKVLYQHIREKFPKINIYYVSLKPCPLRWSMKDRMMDANKQIKKFCKKQKNTHFINIWDKMLQNRKPISALFIGDSLHMNKKGYEIWTKEIRKKIGKE
ncbi:G-D-S-L family lipolytic protein [Flavobacterium psychrotolerans]|uniref:G-D-S-L family lipolytic protein n=2 Tax=Flavobacterium psychrotolerans TaxID=2169410 RepID=A0A2U1JFS0_9FLAO|nr:G-D-S-L family lipolytic protein [Flavobacterium psychrotolerans]